VCLALALLIMMKKFAPVDSSEPRRPSQVPPHGHPDNMPFQNRDRKGAEESESASKL
jgi:hypothetical protein